MKEHIISFDAAKLAKEKGFTQIFKANERFHYNTISNTLCDLELNENSFFNLHYRAVSQSILQRWLREVHNCIVEVLFCKQENINILQWHSTVDYYTSNWQFIPSEESDFVSDLYDTYEEALEIGLIEALKLLNNEK